MAKGSPRVKKAAEIRIQHPHLTVEEAMKLAGYDEKQAKCDRRRNTVRQRAHRLNIKRKSPDNGTTKVERPSRRAKVDDQSNATQPLDVNQGNSATTFQPNIPLTSPALAPPENNDESFNYYVTKICGKDQAHLEMPDCLSDVEDTHDITTLHAAPAMPGGETEVTSPFLEAQNVVRSEVTHAVSEQVAVLDQRIQQNIMSLHQNEMEKIHSMEIKMAIMDDKMAIMDEKMVSMNEKLSRAVEIQEMILKKVEDRSSDSDPKESGEEESESEESGSEEDTEEDEESEFEEENE